MIFFILSQYIFGQNKVQYEISNWKTIQSENFEVYFQEGSEKLANFSIAVLESTYYHYKKILSFKEDKDKRKILVVIYNSSNEFEETNILFERLPEAVSGFTEAFKNRIVLPYNGEISDFRHTLSHELTHYFQNKVWYGTGLDAFNRRLSIQVPLWFTEGMAEFLSSGWTPECEQYIIDALLNNKIIPLKSLEKYSGYVIYKEGQSVLNFITELYGEKKLGELFNSIRETKSFEKSVAKILGLTVDKLDEMWQRDLKKKYSSVFSERTFIDEKTERLTDHTRIKNYLNYAPTISPDGNVVVYYRDRKGEIEIGVISTIDKKDLGSIVKEGMGRKFESLHILDGHISFSKDNERICFVSKELGKDNIYIYNIKKGKVENKINFDLDRIIWPEFSDDGNKIVFTGVKDGYSDIFFYDLKSKKITRLTNDFWSDLTPLFFNDKILFTSNRKLNSEWDYDEYNLYSVDLNGNIQKILSFSGSIIAPVLKDSTIYFISERSGNRELYAYDLLNKEVFKISDFIEPIHSFSIADDGKKAVFSVLTKSGYDLFLIQDINTMNRKEITEKKEYPLYKIKIEMSEEYTTNDAKSNFSIDYLNPYLYYHSYYGLAAQFILIMSDVLGNNWLYFYFDNSNLLASNLYLQYLFLKHRFDYGLVAEKRTVGFYSYDMVNEYINIGSLYGLGGLIMYPFDTFTRLEFQANGYYLPYDIYEYQSGAYVSSDYFLSLFLNLRYVMDFTLWSGYAPFKGFRGYLRFMGTPLDYKKFWDLQVFETDLRNYFYITTDFNLAQRLYLFHSWGREARFLGTTYIGDIGGVRGYNYDEQEGTYAGLFSMEFRFPLIKVLSLGFPPITISGIKGTLFFDIGGATLDLSNYKFFHLENGFPVLDNLLASYGIEAKINLGITDLNFYVAKRTKIKYQLPNIYYSIYLGYAF